jgi:class 3 adenylate cyclase/pimeloyl-ACP methyl ester carboxylesterase
MDPRLQYATTTDGVSIAYWAMGEGVPLVVPPILVSSHLELEWQIPSRRAAFERLASIARVIHYDCRGMGMSQRDPVDFSVEAAIKDLEAVVDRLDLSRFAILRLPNSASISFAYAARHPERISHLVIWEGHTQDDRDSPRLDQLEAIDPVLDRDWELYLRIRARIMVGWEGSTASVLEDVLRATHTPASMRAMQRELAKVDVTPYLGDITSPTLVLYRVGLRLREEHARLFASRIPDADLVAIRDQAIGHYPNETGIAAIQEFLTPGRRTSFDTRQDGVVSGVRVILFTDLEAHTAMMQRLGDEGGRAVLREHEALTREALAAYGGSEVKTMGDSFMASFPSAIRALECAIAIQKAFAARNETASEPLKVRVGLSAGEPIAEEDDLFGSSVILAARIADQAHGGEIVLANVVRELASGKGFLFSDRGEIALRGFEDPVHLYELRWNGVS